MCTSLQNIVNFYDKSRMERDIEVLFRPKIYPKFELQDFYRHELKDKNKQFNFFLDILEEWNRKIDKNLLPNHSDTLLQKNTFVFNTLRNSIMQPLASSEKVLNHLYKWFNNTRNKNVEPVQRKIDELEEHDEDWLVRNTFKSNLPAEIDMYRRRFCKLPDNDKLGLVKAHQLQREIKNRKVKTQSWDQEEFGIHNKKLQAKRVMNIENDIVRFQREAKELREVEKIWKTSKNREQQGGIKNFYRANFSTSKIYFPKKKREKENFTSSKSIGMKRVQTSLGIRSYSKQKFKGKRFSQGGDEHPVSVKQNEEKQFSFDEFEEIKLCDIAGVKMMAGPQQTKLKKKKRAK